MALKRRQAEASKDAAVSPFLPFYTYLSTIYLYGHGVHGMYVCMYVCMANSCPVERVRVHPSQACQ